MSEHHTLSRVAERIYWMGRYLERCQNITRLVRTHADLLIDLPIRLQSGWLPLIDITGSRAMFDGLYDEPNEKNVVRFLTGDANNPGSIVSSLSAARENARTVRESMPRVSFEHINDAYLYARTNLVSNMSRARRRAALVNITKMIEHVDGFLSGNMLHDSAWGFMRIGNFIERADLTTRVIDVPTLQQEGLEPYNDLTWRAALRSLYALEAYHATMQQPVTQGPVLEFLLTNPLLPRSLMRCVDALRRSLRQLPRHEQPLRLVNRLRRHILAQDFSKLTGDTLHDFVDRCQIDLGDIDARIGRTYFYFKPRRAASATGRSQRQSSAKAPPRKPGE